MRFLQDIVALMRPHQWLKNVFVFAGLVFSEIWHDGPLNLKVMNAFAAFCCASSVVYIFNDWKDRADDSRHPVKCNRPLANGAVKSWHALTLAAALLCGGLWFALDSPKLSIILGLYVAMNVAYSFGLKQVPVVDVSIIASGFMLRLLAGTVAVGIPPSRWMLLTGLFVALFLGFSKRKAESLRDVANQRAILEHYPAALLDMFMAVNMTATLITYGLFATSPEAQLQHGERLVYTVPIVVFAMLRYAYQVQRGRGEDVSKDLFRDPWILLSAAAWLLVFLGRRF
jgi:decaprenyl-phosphate phosphoribosyltransferase